MEHQISELMRISMTNIRELIDVNIVVGNPITSGNTTIIPVSKVKCGFVSGGFDQKKIRIDDSNKNPFGGGAAGNLSITPVAFLVCNESEVKVLHLDDNSHIFEKIIESVPDLIDKVMKATKSEATKFE